ncbi:MAG: cyclic pyranopterin monophosphate synthase MoaC [Conexivisphaera sp.]
MREATVTGFLSTERDVAAELAMRGVSGLGNAAAVAKVVAISSAKLAWRYVPALPRSLLAATYAAVRYEEDGMRIWVMVKSELEDGAQAYAAFGAFAGLLAAWNTVKGCSRSCRPSSRRPCTAGNVRGILGLRAVDVQWEEVEGADNSGGPPEVGFFDVSEEPLYDGLAQAMGSVRPVSRDERVAREAERVAREAAPRAWEILPLVHMNEITSLSASSRLEDGSLKLALEVENRGRTGSAMEAAFGVGVALINAWATEGGDKVVEGVEVLRSLKVPRD